MIQIERFRRKSGYADASTHLLRLGCYCLRSPILYNATGTFILVHFVSAVDTGIFLRTKRGGAE
jgi:hypothetical protein